MSGIYQRSYLDKNYDAGGLAEAAESPEILSSIEAYWLAKCLIDCEYQNTGHIISCIRHAFNSGLNYSTDREKYLDGAQILSGLYIQNGNYVYAANYLMDMADRLSPVPDWVNIYYLLSQVMSDTIYRIGEDPYFFFKRLDEISCKSADERSALYSIALNRLYAAAETDAGKNIDIQKFEALKTSYITETSETDDEALASLLNNVSRTLTEKHIIPISTVAPEEIEDLNSAVERNRDEYLQRVYELKNTPKITTPLIIVRKRRK